MVLLLLTIVGGALRYLGCRNDLWLDELISLHNASRLQSVWQVFFALHSDNNHYLNTLYLFSLGNHSYSFAARYFSVLCGTASIVAAYWAGVRHSRTTGLTFATLVTFSYPLIHFSSEARGYGSAMLACIVSYGALARWLETTSKSRLRLSLVYIAAVCFGVPSHLTFVFIFASLVIWSVMSASSSRNRLYSIALNLPPLMLLSALWLLDLRYATTLGGVFTTGLSILSRLLANAAGWPLGDTWIIWLLGAPAVILAVREVWKLHQAGQDNWLFFALILAIPPLCLAVIRLKAPQSYISLRYFLVFVPFWLLLLAIALHRLRRHLLIALLGLFVAGNATLYARFLSVGRGQYSEALRFIARNTTGPTIAIASDQDFRAGVELDYYQRVLPPNQKLRYITNSNLGHELPQWVIMQSEALDPPLPATLVIDTTSYSKVAYYGCSELAGQAWTIYQLPSRTGGTEGH